MEFDYLFALALLKIIWIDILLSGDNAVVIALACKDLGDKRKIGIVLGAGTAVALRITATAAIVFVLQVPYIKLVGGIALLFIAVKMLMDEDDKAEESKPGASKLYQAVAAVAVADIVMSIDNVIAIAAAANGSLVLIAIGLALSIPLVVSGAALISLIIDKFPILVWAGAALLGYIAGETIVTDPFVSQYVRTEEWIVGIAGALSVLMLGRATQLMRTEAHV